MNTGRMRCIKNNGMKRNGKRIAGLMRVLMLSILMMLTLAVPAMAQTDGVDGDGSGTALQGVGEVL